MPPTRRQAAKTRAAAAKAAKAKKVIQEKEVEQEEVDIEPEVTPEAEPDPTEVETDTQPEQAEIVQEDESEQQAYSEETYEEGTEVQQSEGDGMDEEMGEEVGEEMVEGEGQAVDEEGNLFAIDKTPMDDEEMASKIDSKDEENTAEGGKVWPKPEKELPLRGRVLRVHPIRMQDLAGKNAAPILRASLGYIIRSEGGGKPQKKTSTMDAARSLEIWFHSEEEAEEMFVKMCKFNWNVNGRPARIVRVNTPESVDVTLKEWDKTIAPFGMYDGRCLFVNHVPANTTEDDLKELFENTKKIVIPTDEEENQQGYALIEFWSRDDAVESSKKKLTMGETQLTLHTLGIQRIPRMKAAQDRLDQEMKRIREQGVSTDFPSPRFKQPRNSRDDRRDGRRQGGGGFQRDRNRQAGGNRRDGRRNQGRRDDGGWGNKRRSTGGRDNASPFKRGRMDSGGRFGGGGGGGGGGRNRGRFGGGRGGEVDHIRGELLDQMQNLQSGGLSDPSYLMNLAKRLQQAQGGQY